MAQGGQIGPSSNGPLAGFVFFLDPSNSPAKSSELSGSSELYFEGLIYLPQQPGDAVWRFVDLYAGAVHELNRRYNHDQRQRNARHQQRPNQNERVHSKRRPRQSASACSLGECL